MTKRQLTPLKTAISTFVLDSKSRRLSPRTLGFYSQQIGWFYDWISEYTTDLEDITATHVRTYLSKRVDDGVSPSTVSAAYRALNRLFTFCVEEEFIEKSPMDRVKAPRVPDKVPPAFTKKDIEKILKACVSRRDRCIVLVLVDSGIRASELIDLRICDVDISSGSVRVVLGKGSKERYTYIGLRTRKEILRYLAETGDSPADTDALFASANGKVHLLGTQEPDGQVGEVNGDRSLRPQVQTHVRQVELA